MTKFFIIFTLLWLEALVSANADLKLIYANVVWRHGDRTPVFTLPDDPESLWPRGLGQLTNIGIKQEYELGRFLRHEYDKLVPKQYNVNDIYIRSTDKDRALVSAQASLDGFYRPTENETWNGNATTWFPVPVHTIPLEHDDLLKYPNTCPNYLSILNEMHSTEWYKKYSESLRSDLDFISKNTGIKDVNTSNFYLIFDNLVCKKAHNISLPAWVTDEWYSKMLITAARNMGYQYTDKDKLYRKVLSKVEGGNFVKTILQNFKDKIENKTTLKMIGYSAHDMTIIALLVAIDSYNWLKPPYSSAVLMNLYSDSKNYFVEFKYRNSSGPAFPVKFLGCDYMCPFDKFTTLAQTIIPEDFSKTCGGQMPQYINSLYPILVSFLVIIMLFTIIFCFVFKQKTAKNNNHEYAPLQKT